MGTERPTVQKFQDCDTLDQEITMRWTGLYLLLYTDTEPTHVGVFCASGDR
jgi:hypothetical protein